MAAPIPQKILARKDAITEGFLIEIDKHLADVVSGKAEDMYEIRDIAALMHIHPTHLSNTIKLTTGKAPCFFFEQKIMDIAKKELAETNRTIADIATWLTFDPSNFTKFFRRFAGITPKEYRQQLYIQTSS